MAFSVALLSAMLLDAILGDPRGYPHPVKLIGALCLKLQSLLRKLAIPELSAGALLVGVTLIAVLLLTLLPLLAVARISPIIAEVLATLVLYTTVAVRDLLAHSLAVMRSLEQDRLLEAREKLGRIVGRETSALDQEGVSRATIETVAENMVDGIAAPLFWATLCSLLALAWPISPAILAATGAMLYKAINTLDSMVGYKNSQYLYFGRAAARLDDFMNLVPARVSSLCLVPASLLLRLDWRGSITIYRRDRGKHCSPNAGHPEAAVAGALGIQLGGPSQYFGEIIEKPRIGDASRQVVVADIATTNKLVVYGTAFFVLILLLARFWLTGGW
jgi:adenosylcobinamide-phosphate synthase